MTRRLLTFVVGVIVAATFAVAADEPPPEQNDAPLRLKKKKKADMGEPKPEPKLPLETKPDDKKPDDKKNEKKADDLPGPITKDGEPVDPEEDEKEILERVARNAKTVEDRLVNKEINEGTRQLQDDIVKDLDSLIKNAENPQGGQGEEDMQEGNDNQNNGQDKQGKGNTKGSMKKSSGGKKGQQARGSRQQKGTAQAKAGQGDNPNGQSKQPMGQGQAGQNPGAGGSSKDNRAADPHRDADLFKDTWGHLPETLRAQMDAYSNREKYMDKHQELIKQYYKTIAAQGKNKGKD